jgi:hypothetical protein
MQHLKNQYCSNCKRKKLEDRVIGKIKALLSIIQSFWGASRHVESRTNLVSGDAEPASEAV